MEITYYENKVSIYVCILGDGIYRWTQENSFDVLLRTNDKNRKDN